MSVVTIGFPTNVVFLIVMTMVATATGIWLVISQGLRDSASRLGHTWRWGAAVVLAVWLILLIALAATSPGGAPLDAAYPVTSLLVGISLGLLPLLLSPAFRRAVRSIPKVYVIGLHAIRVMGVLFLALADMKLLPPQFALPAGYGDVTVGLLSLAMVYLLATRRPYARWELRGTC